MTSPRSRPEFLPDQACHRQGSPAIRQPLRCRRADQLYGSQGIAAQCGLYFRIPDLILRHGLFLGFPLPPRAGDPHGTNSIFERFPSFPRPFTVDFPFCFDTVLALVFLRGSLSSLSSSSFSSSSLSEDAFLLDAADDALVELFLIGDFEVLPALILRAAKKNIKRKMRHLLS